MFGYKTLIFAALFVLCTVGALGMPLLGVLGYSGHYIIGPESQWWEKPLQGFGVRYSLVLAVATFAGMMFNIRGLRWGKSFLSGQEKLLLLFLGMVWLSTLLSPQTDAYTKVDHPSVKFTKVVIFLLMLTHIVTSIRKMNYLMWTYVVGALLLGLQAYYTPRRSFRSGRLEGIGGPDFSESNFLAAFMAGMLVIIAIQFMRSKWKGKIFCAISGAFAANTIVLTRSRGVLLGLGTGTLTALIMAPKEYRMKILAGLVVAALGMFYLTDPQTLERFSSVTTDQSQMDTASQSRIVLIKTGLRMFAEHPATGVGVGNFKQTIGRYQRDFAGKAAHNTYILCLTETGALGAGAFLAVIVAGIASLRRSMRRCRELPKDKQNEVFYPAYGLCVAMATMLGCGLPIHMTYTEGFWWILMLPTAMGRVMDNYVEDIEIPADLKKRRRRSEDDKKRSRRRPGRLSGRRRLGEPEPAGTHWR